MGFYHNHSLWSCVVAAAENPQPAFCVVLNPHTGSLEGQETAMKKCSSRVTAAFNNEGLNSFAEPQSGCQAPISELVWPRVHAET